MLSLRRHRRPVALLCVAVLVLAVAVPGMAIVAIPGPPVDWVLLPEIAPLATIAALPIHTEQLLALRASLPLRAPPRATVAAGL